jgi:hypothetical protein
LFVVKIKIFMLDMVLHTCNLSGCLTASMGRFIDLTEGNWGLRKDTKTDTEKAGMGWVRHS